MGNESKRRIAIVTDSTADIPRKLVEEYDIRVVPQVRGGGRRLQLLDLDRQRVGVDHLLHRRQGRVQVGDRRADVHEDLGYVPGPAGALQRPTPVRPGLTVTAGA